MVGVSTFAVGGGLDLTTAALAVPPTRVIAAENYEPLSEGYGRMPGYERFDGSPYASAASFWLLPFATGGAPIEEGEAIVGAASGATGTVIALPIGFTGDWDVTMAAGTLLLTDVTGMFQAGEFINVAGLPRANVAGTATRDTAATKALTDSYREAAQIWRRERIEKVPGDGPVRGVAEYNGSIYAWRDNLTHTNCAMWRGTTTGWASVPLGRIIEFSAGLVEISDGDVIAGVTSGAVATVVRAVRQTGDWGSTAAGYLVIATQTNSFQAEAIRVGAVNVATISGPSIPITLPPGGRYMTINHNFYGAANLFRMYGVNGVGRGFEFDGTVLVPIRTGMADDRPRRIAEISQHLLMSFPGGSLQHSGIGEPLFWDVILGAGEIGIGTEITDLVQSNETAVAIFGQQRVAILTGRDQDTFLVDELTEEAGADPWTAQRIGQTVYLDRRGLRSLAATAAFGNFKTGTVAPTIEPLFRSKRTAGATPVLSLVSRAKSQYRLFWSDGTGLTLYMGRKDAEPLPFDLGDVRVSCGMTAELADGTEGIFIGAEDGFVYRMDSGTSFDGEAVKGFLMFPFNHVGAAMLEKRLHKISMEMIAEAETQIGVTVQFDYSDGGKPYAPEQERLVRGSGGIWNASNWNEFYWSAPFEGLAEFHMDGIGRNMSITMQCRSRVTEAPHIIQAYHLHTSPRKMKR